MWLLEELNLEYTIKPYIRTGGPRAPPELKAVHPLGKAPVLVVEYADGKEKVIAESGHIIAFLIRNFDKESLLTPDNTDAFDEVEYYLHMCEGTLQPVLTFLLVLNTAASRAPWFVKPVISSFVTKVFELYNYKEIILCLDFLETKLGENAAKLTASSQNLFFVNNKLSGADIIFALPVGEICIIGDKLSHLVDKSKYPHLVRWAHEIRERPAYLRAMEKTGQYEKPKEQEQE